MTMDVWLGLLALLALFMLGCWLSSLTAKALRKAGERWFGW